MYLYKVAILLVLNIVFVQAWYTTVVENGKTIVRTKSRSRSSTATSSSTATTSSTTTSSTTTTSTAFPSPTNTLSFYNSLDCTGDSGSSSNNDGCFSCDISAGAFSVSSTYSSWTTITFYLDTSCSQRYEAISIPANTCSTLSYPGHPLISSYTVTTL